LFDSKIRTNTTLENATERALKKLDHLEVTSKEYGEVLDRVSKLHKMKEEEKPSSVSKDTLIKAGANLLGILMIIHHEQVNFIGSKALPFVKPQ
jgi:hypothetical protein